MPLRPAVKQSQGKGGEQRLRGKNGTATPAVGPHFGPGENVRKARLAEVARQFDQRIAPGTTGRRHGLGIAPQPAEEDGHGHDDQLPLTDAGKKAQIWPPRSPRTASGW